MKILVIGGGIGGLTTTIALRQRGFDAHVYEAAPELAPVGKGIWVPTNAMLVLDRLGLGDRVAARGIPLQRIELHDRWNGLLQAADMQRIRQQFGRTTVSIHRAALQEALAAAIPAESIHLGKRCVRVHQDGQRVVAHFADGSEATGDILIGADGIRSAVRSAVAPDAALRHAGQTCYLGIAHLRLPPALARTVREVWGGALRFGFSAVEPERVYWFAPMTAAAGAADPLGSTGTVVDALAERYADFLDPIPGIIRHTPEDEVLRVDLHDLQPLKRWWQGRIALVGDAAHAMTPNLGQGGAQAIEDAYVIADSLAQAPTPQEAFAAYARVRRARAQRIARTAWWFGKLAHLEAGWARALRNWALLATPARIQRRQLTDLYSLRY
jgi:2-polyprenyl-6-methoxyphenol hydroxylase-like FAD-dependent oxidoreductase